MITTKEFDYNIPANLIAACPVSPRDSSRLLVFETQKNTVSDQIFYNIGNYLKSGDLLILNNSKVMPARIIGRRQTTGEVEILLLKKIGKYWDVLIGGKIKIKEKIFFAAGLEACVIAKDGKNGLLKFNFSGAKFWQKVNKIGKMPIPPYIKNSKLSETDFRREYQTVYAKTFGSAAAPTAGLHFTLRLIKELKSAGIGFASVDLHVGIGTFAPINDEEIRNKKLHMESFSIPAVTIKKIVETKKTGGRIIAVGTTTVRALESVAKKILSAEKIVSGSTDIFIQPGDNFKIVDGLITNFHLPKSSLMMLVAAFLQHRGIDNGRKKLLELYNIAINKEYRFYSFGDAILII